MGNFNRRLDRHLLADSVEKVDVERSPAIPWRMWFDNALNLLMRKLSHSQHFCIEESKTDFFNRIGRQRPSHDECDPAFGTA